MFQFACVKTFSGQEACGINKQTKLNIMNSIMNRTYCEILVPGICEENTELIAELNSGFNESF